MIIVFAGLGTMFLLFIAQSALGAAGRDTLSSSQMVGAAALASAAWLVAAGFWWTRLVIGQRGFRYVMPFRSFQLSWSQVSSVEVVSRGKGDSLVVWLYDEEHTQGSKIKIGAMATFSASNREICDLMNERHAASEMATPASGDHSGRTPRP